MKHINDLFTPSKARLHCIRADSSKNYHWVFLPGGPGLGSESLADLTKLLHLPGSIWHADLPGDGSNLTDDDTRSFSHWQRALIEITTTLPNVILAAHSTGGMFALATPEIEKNIVGLVLMDSAPNSSWQNYFAQYVKENPIPAAEKWLALYNADPSNETLKQLTIVCAPYSATHTNITKIISLLKSLPFNYKTQQWAENHFDRTYQAQWIPKTLPTLIFAGDQDPITPLTLFSESDAFKRDNILIRTISHASHFPWIDNPNQVRQIFAEYCNLWIK